NNIMKLRNLITLSAVAALLALTAVGCKTGPQRPTRIPGYESGIRDIPEPPISPNNNNNNTRPIPPIPPIVGDTRLPDESLNREMVPAKVQPFVGETVHFDFDKSIVKASEMPKVERVASAMRGYTGKALRVDGHCDERGTEDYNRSL